MKEALQGEEQSMLARGKIEESTSPWRSPPVLVPKPDCSLRFCINFRWLNEITDFDAYPMPCINNILDRIGGAHVLTTLELTKGYWQIPGHPEDKPQTAFATPSRSLQIHNDVFWP